MLRAASPRVVVAGASPTGLLAALCLARERIPIQILDCEGPEYEASCSGPRVAADLSVLAPSTLALLQESDLAVPVLEAAQRVERVVVEANAEPIAELSFAELAADGTPFPYVAILSLVRLREILKGALRREQVEVLPHRRLALLEQGRARVRATIEHLGKDSVGYAVAHTEFVVEKSEELETSFLLVTDGQAAPARAQLGLALLEAGAAETYLEVEGQAQRPVGAAVSVDQDTSSALWPLPGVGYRALFSLPEWETGITDGARLAARIPWLIPTGAPHAVSEFRVHACSVEPCGIGRIWLAGGAAHSTSALASQSLNAGLWEASQLAQVFARALRGADPTQALARHQRQRAREWQRLLGKSRLRGLPGANNLVARHADRILPCLPARGAELAALLAQLHLGWA
jgi:2-polyprenyl-6-methoxyphenol hydroxylase-like FAD-dependent oxidoreductase